MNTSLKKEIKYPKVYGITGGIGSGKSTIAKILIAMGFPVFDSDEAAKQIINNDKVVIELIENNFGNVYVNNKIDTKKLANIVFNNKEKLQELNKIIHPKVTTFFDNWKKENHAAELLFKEAAILIETGGYKKLAGLILVVADKKERIERIKQRDNINEQEIISKMNNQLSDSEKKKYANFIITNNDEDMLIPQLLKILSKIKNKKTTNSR